MAHEADESKGSWKRLKGGTSGFVVNFVQTAGDRGGYVAITLTRALASVTRHVAFGRHSSMRGVMNTLYPMEFQRRVDRRWAERMNAAGTDARGSMAHARSAGQRRNQARHAREALNPSTDSDAANDRSAAPIEEGRMPPPRHSARAMTKYDRHTR
jgi:hypothetical protein